MEFNVEYKRYAGIVNDALAKLVNEVDCPEKEIYSAMNYSLLAGGKRFRPVLALAVCDMLGGDIKEVLPYACGIEMIHTYSLIHDDLPAMDNDDYRRGRLTNHKVYGEAIAILAGDALLNTAFEIMLEHTVKSVGDLTPKVKAMNIIAKASGVSGMIGGQVVDIKSEGKVISIELLKHMHRCKTGALITAPVMAAAVLCGSCDANLVRLSQYAEKIGLAFQIKDDILDIEGDPGIMGKASGSDLANGKSTFVSVLGIEEAKKILNTTADEAIECILPFGDRGSFLKRVVLFIINREN